MKKEYTLEKEPKSAIDDKIEAKEIPVYLERCELSDEQKQRLIREFEPEFDAIKEERSGESLEQKWESEDNQYSGKMREDTRLQFNLNRNITRPIVNRVVNYIKQGFFKSDPIYSISPRPEFDRQGGQDVADKQQDFLDYKLDNLPFRSPVGKVILSAVKHGIGILKIPHVIKYVSRTREERYQGNPVVGIDAMNRPIIVNTGLNEFLSNWPDAPKDYPGLIKKLQEGGEINIIAKYKDIIYNDPLPQFIDLKNFYVRLSTEGYDGLSDTKLIVERKTYTYWELKQEEKTDKFYDIDKLIAEEKDKGKKRQGYEKEVYDILECTFFFRLDEKDTEETRIVFWLAEKEKVIIGCVHYPHDVMYYIPFYISEENAGFYQPGLAEIVKDSHISQSVLLNLLLGGIYIRNTITPVTKDQETINQFLEKRFVHGIPLEADPGKVDFLQKYMSAIDVGGIVNTMQLLKQGDEEGSGSSSLMSGQETPFDPNAPASKTMALLKQAGLSIDEYISCMTVSFNQVAYVLLQIYYQMSTEGRKYKIRPEKVVGDNPFGVISRNEMIARTNIQAQAYAYDFDKLQAKQEDFALWQILRNDPVFNSNPDSVWNMARVLVKNWSAKWNNNVDKLLPNAQEYQQKQLQTAIQAVSIYLKGLVEQANTTGIAPQIDPRQLMGVIAQMQKEAITPPTKEELKSRGQNV